MQLWYWAMNESNTPSGTCKNWYQEFKHTKFSAHAKAGGSWGDRSRTVGGKNRRLSEKKLLQIFFLLPTPLSLPLFFSVDKTSFPLRRQNFGMALRGALRSIVRSLSSPRVLSSSGVASHHLPMNFITGCGPAALDPVWRRSCSHFSTSTGGLLLNSLTDTRFSKRRPGLKPRRKRASLKPPGPYAWVQYVPGEPIPKSRPNKGSVQGRKRKKRIAQRKAFILSENKKRKSQYAEFRRKRDMERIERKMAAVAREKAWAERLVELQQLEAEKKAAMIW